MCNGWEAQNSRSSGKLSSSSYLNLKLRQGRAGGLLELHSWPISSLKPAELPQPHHVPPPLTVICFPTVIINVFGVMASFPSLDLERGPGALCFSYPMPFICFYSTMEGHDSLNLSGYAVQ